MLIAALLAITLDPALRLALVRRGLEIIQEERHPLTRLLIRVYEPALQYALQHKGSVAAIILVAAATTIPVYRRLGVEFVPPLDEGVLLYMPSTLPGISITEAKRLLQLADARLKSLPEVAQPLGKAGRADSPTDAAPFSMLETIVVLKPRERWPAMSHEELIVKFDAVIRFPGVVNTWTMPVRGRIDMLATGMRSPLGLKIAGPKLDQIQELGIRVEELLHAVRGTRSVFAERIQDGRYIDIQWDRAALARAGISMEEAQTAVQNAIGGDNVTTAIQGRAHYSVSVRLPRDRRENLDAMRQVLVDNSAGGDAVPLGQLAAVHIAPGPAMIRDENGMLTAYVYLDVDGRDSADYIAEAQGVLARQLRLPAGYTVTWSGQYEVFQRVSRRLFQVVPLTLALIAVLLCANTRSVAKTTLVLLAVPFSAIGAIWSLWSLGYPLSPAVWVGLIALLGVDAETGIFMLLYLDLAWQKRVADGRMQTPKDLREAVITGAVRRIRPKFMTVATMFLGLVPILWSTAAGAEVMKRIAAPMVGGLATSFLMELIAYPVLYERWRSRSLHACFTQARTLVQQGER